MKFIFSLFLITLSMGAKSSYAVSVLPYSTCYYDSDDGSGLYLRIGRFLITKDHADYSEINGEIKIRNNGHDNYINLSCIATKSTNGSFLRCLGKENGTTIRVRVKPGNQRIGVVMISTNEDRDYKDFQAVESVLPLACQ